jgi:hypothetical protein
MVKPSWDMDSMFVPAFCSPAIWFTNQFIPALSDLTAEGPSYDEAVHNARHAAEVFLSKVKITTIELNSPVETLRRGSPQAVLNAAGRFKGDETAMQQHLDEIYAERRVSDGGDTGGAGNE